jgi:hypothetical protein
LHTDYWIRVARGEPDKHLIEVDEVAAKETQKYFDGLHGGAHQHRRRVVLGDSLGTYRGGASSYTTASPTTRRSSGRPSTGRSCASAHGVPAA